MLLRSLALRDEAMALCGSAVDMDLWKLAPINDIFEWLLRSSDATCQRHKNCKIDGVLRPSVATPGIPSTQAF